MAQALKATWECHELADVAEDLNKAEWNMEQIKHSNLLSDRDERSRQYEKRRAWELNDELRKKYPVIERMLAVADRLSSSYAMLQTSAAAGETVEYRVLQQDYFGILCHVLLKKGITQNIEQIIENVD